MNYISLEINKDGKNVEILLGGTVLEGSDMQGGIRLLINNIEASLLNSSLLDKTERESAHHDKQDELEEQPTTTAPVVPQEVKPEEPEKSLKQPADKKAVPAKGSAAILSRAVIDLINAECSAKGLSMLGFNDVIGKLCGRKPATIGFYYYQRANTPVDVAHIIGEVIGYQLEVKKDEFGEKNWFPVKQCDKTRDLPVKQKNVKKVHKSVQKNSKSDDVRCHLSTELLAKIDEYLKITKFSKAKLAKLLAAKSDKAHPTILNMFYGALRMPESLALSLAEILGISISRSPNMLGEEKWTIASTDKGDNDLSEKSEAGNNAVTRLSTGVLKRIKEYRTAMAIDEMLFAYRIANNSGLPREAFMDALQSGDVSDEVATAIGDVLQAKLHKVMFADGGGEWSC
ncbi:MAG: hypothetical protein AB7F25_02635 [Deferribacterales bacterium]